MAIYVSGSLAFDRIMQFGGNFKDHLLKDRLDQINISFSVESMIERRGGCAGNIAYTLALLGEKPLILSCAGRDFAGYAAHLGKMGLSTEGIRVEPRLFTALCFITTDLSGNQISGFYPGALARPSDYVFPELSGRDLAIVSPGNMEDMAGFPARYREAGVPFLLDPGQQLPVFTREIMVEACRGALAFISNDYELGMTLKLLGAKEEDLLESVQWIVTTLGPRGCRVRGRDGTDEIIPAVPCREVLDPTGAGDAQRSGLLFGLARGLSLPEALRYGAVTASYAIECRGTQEHFFTKEDFRARYEAAFGPMPVAL